MKNTFIFVCGFIPTIKGPLFFLPPTVIKRFTKYFFVRKFFFFEVITFVDFATELCYRIREEMTFLCYSGLSRSGSGYRINRRFCRELT